MLNTTNKINKQAITNTFEYIEIAKKYLALKVFFSNEYVSKRKIDKNTLLIFLHFVFYLKNKVFFLCIRITFYDNCLLSVVECNIFTQHLPFHWFE